MGRQVNFYMHEKDMHVFEQAVTLRNGVYFITPVSQGQSLSAFKSIDDLNREHAGIIFYIVREIDVSRIIFKSSPSTDMRAVDTMRSPVVEVLRSYQTDTMIRRGRLFFDTRYYTDSSWTEKPKDFIRWANSLIRWVRKHYIKEPSTGFYIGPYAQEWVVQRNGKLRF